jgi:DNA modification methylase
MHDDGRLEYNARGVPRIKRFMEEMDGVPVRDTWDDISSIQGTEKRDYATQKPVKLLERIVGMYSSEGDLCLDPFAGSGTTGRACATLGRRCVMFDKNPKALDVFNTK